MSFKPNPAPLSCTTLPDGSLLRVSGRDAAAFLQAQAMNDVAALAPGRWHWNGFLTPKGRVMALFALLRETQDQFLLVLPDVAAQEMAEHLQRFVFRSKLSLLPLDHWRVCAGPAQAGPDPAQARGTPDEAWALDLSGTGTARAWWLLPADHTAVAGEDPGVTLAWRQQDLAHGLPRLGPGLSGDWTPQMLSLDRLAAYSVKKGCYPGQEIVARTHYLGQAKRGLARFTADRELAPGLSVSNPQGRELGTVVCVAGRELLAVLPADPGEGPFSAGGVPLAAGELLDGLARSIPARLGP